MDELLRFLTQKCKLPLGQSLTYVKELIHGELVTEEAIAGASLARLREIIHDDEGAKKIFSAAKRGRGKRGHPSSKGKDQGKDKDKEGGRKKRKRESSPPDFTFNMVDEPVLQATSVTTNRAPWLLAWTYFVLLKTYTPTTALSLAKGYMAASAQSKARSLGLADAAGPDETLLLGSAQPTVTIFGKSIPILRRRGAEEEEEEEGEELRAMDVAAEDFRTHDPISAWMYMKNAFGPEFEAVMTAMHMVTRDVGEAGCRQRGYGWYMSTRPDIPHGVQGWGKKGTVSLADVLSLRPRPAHDKKESEKHKSD